jgi:ferredoxin-NADP reductase
MKIPARLGKIESIADGTWAVEFELNDVAEYRPGQTVDITLPEPPHTDAAGDTRTFSCAGAPGRPRLLIATRSRGSAFKRSLVELPHGSHVVVDGFHGSFTLPNKPTHAFLLAGGIGVTPFRAMAEDAIERRLEHRIVLVHSSRTPEEAPFLRELTGWSTGHATFRYLPVMTRAADSKEGWNGERRRVDAALLADIIPADRDEPLYYVAGPERFVKGVASALRALGVDEDRVRAEEFPGY